MYKLVDIKLNLYGVLDTCDSTVSYVVLEDLCKVVLERTVEIEGANEIVYNYIEKLKILGKEYDLYEKIGWIVLRPDDTIYSAKKKLSNLSNKPYKVLNFSNITKMTYLFANCNATELDLSEFDTSKVTSMQNMFTKCKTPKLDLSNFDTSNVTDMGWMFSESGVEEIIFSTKMNISKLKNAFGIFAYCMLKKITIPKSASIFASGITNDVQIIYL